MTRVLRPYDVECCVCAALPGSQCLRLDGRALGHYHPARVDRAFAVVGRALDELRTRVDELSNMNRKAG